MTFDLKKLRGALILAPMSGISNSPFRRICAESGADFCLDEMIPAEGIIRAPKKLLKQVDRFHGEEILWLQVFGKTPRSLADAARACEAMGADAVDLNMGCPARRVTGSGSGSALLKDTVLAAKIFNLMRTAVKIPLSVKVRTGWDDKSVAVFEIAKLAEAEGFDIITVHPRTRMQFFGGKADWRVIRAVKEQSKMIVIGNGDVDGPEAAAKMFFETGCDAVMIGRGALGRPWIFGEAREFIANKRFSQTAPEKKLEALLMHIDLMCDHIGAEKGLIEMRKFFIWYFKGMRDAKEFRSKIFSIYDPAACKAEIREYFGKQSVTTQQERITNKD